MNIRTMKPTTEKMKDFLFPTYEDFCKWWEVKRGTIDHKKEIDVIVEGCRYRRAVDVFAAFEGGYAHEKGMV